MAGAADSSEVNDAGFQVVTGNFPSGVEPTASLTGQRTIRPPLPFSSGPG